MTREELIYLGAVQIYAAFEANPPRVGRDYVPRGLKEDEALSIATDMYGILPKYVKYAKKLYKEEKESHQITDEEIEWSEFDNDMMNAIICLTKQGRHLEEEHINWIKNFINKLYNE